VTNIDNLSAEKAGTGAIGGTAIGGLGGLLAGLTVITIPGFGPIITAGTLITTLGATAAGAGIGAATGGIVGALKGTGISEEDAHVYAENIRRGGLLLTVEVEEKLATQVFEVLDEANATDITAPRDEPLRSEPEHLDETSASDSERLPSHEPDTSQ
jgi:hypothetical protein